MSRWETTSALEADISPAAVWAGAYANAEAWPEWNAEIKRAKLDGPLALSASAKILFGTGLRLRFRGSRLTNTIYIEGPLTALWRRVMGPAAARTLPGAQRAVVELARQTSAPTDHRRAERSSNDG